MANRSTREWKSGNCLPSFNLATGSDNPPDNSARGDYKSAITENKIFFEAYVLDLSDFLGEIQLGRKFNITASEQIDENSQKLAQLFKNESLLPKLVLNEIRMAIKILLAEAAYMPNEHLAMKDMANRLELTFDLILLGEDHGDRIPGVPRII